MTEKKKFSPLIFLASLGAGGISVIPFAWLQYSHPHGPGLIKLPDIGHGTLTNVQELYFLGLEAVMVIFAIIHIVLTVIFIKQLAAWMKTEDFRNLIANPLTNAGILAPFISITMTMNVMIGPIRFFTPIMQENFQAMMLPAVIVWGVIWLALLLTEVNLLKISFSKGFDIEKINFGWLLHPFALGMVTVTGTGIAAMAQNPDIANTAAFMSAVSGSMGLFLLLVKLVVIFKSHFAAKGLPEKQFLPSFLIVIPNLTLYAISLFRFGHFLEKQHGFEMGSFFLIVTLFAFAFETWYMLFGLSLLSDYFKKHYFKGEFYVTQWGLICPIVAYAVLGSFVYSTFIASPVLAGAVILAMVTAIIFYFDLLVRNMRCKGVLNMKPIECT